MREIQLTQGFKALVDDEDYKSLVRFKWCAVWRGSHVYAAKNNNIDNGIIYMHRAILNAPAGVKVDHRKHFVAARIVDNRKSNIRLAPGFSNAWNTVKNSSYKHSIFKGVRKQAKEKPWQAFITANRQSRHIGSFYCEGYAALAYDIEAVKEFGDFALTNFPITGSSNSIFGLCEE